MDSHLRDTILKATDADDVFTIGTIQSLWSGYGSIDRYGLVGSQYGSVIVKHVRLPERSQHPRGWDSDHSHRRKLRSYRVETAWYRDWAARCDEDCRVPQCLALEQREGEFLMIMEDLSSSGYPSLKQKATQNQMIVCLKWLANFHAKFLEEKPQGLWKTGTYWHLKTRPDEVNAMRHGKLKQVASLLDVKLSDAPFQTIVHGDAKLANFCFSADGTTVAAVDFQYVGGGCGMKDVAYFIGSCLDEHDCERLETALLDAYFDALKKALGVHQASVDPKQVEAIWRPLYAVAWTDFYRFLQGWSPSHWKIHGYSERLAREVVNEINNNQ